MLKLFGKSEPNPSTILANWIFFGLAIFVVLFFLLGEVSNCESTQFCSTIIFFMVFFGSFIMLLALWLLSSTVRDRMKGTNNVLFFFLSGISLGKLAWIPIGFIGVVAVAFASSASDFEYAPHIGIFVSGMIMLVAFFATNSIFIPVIIHGAYNSMVVLLRTDVGFSALPINVPEIGISYEIVGDLLTEIFFQFTLVANAEEFFKVFAIAFFIVSTKGKFESKGGFKWIAGIVAVLIWVIYHTISSI